MKPAPGDEGAPTGLPAGIDTSVAHPARIWNYWLGGKDNFAADRETGDLILEAIPDMAANARADRAFLVRSVRCMAAEHGVRQFLDVGTGIPGPGNTHEVARDVDPSARVVYVDNDPVVLAHANALMGDDGSGATDYVHADLREPGTVLDAARNTLDLDRPVGVMFLGVLEFVPDNRQAKEIIDAFMDAVPSGSLLALALSTNEVRRENAEKGARIWNEGGSTPLLLRSAADIEAMFAGLELLEPGVVSCTDWRPEGIVRPSDRVAQYCGLARKP
ncbi:SAM-dependent methyltransferase [Nocardiopsis sp. RSe5-2]|uniref:SAM-dependent methyltransferase n=2 Tax=Nocardiopsis endophytica TaxID=3018445 RepID=A0ABT4U3W2_9ACTN|nr:SAM-dependent methyltransferase [Nocardiopsis endophytica]MDA2811646.1 SAM-dependent methyltransferase [Nocardiopsis endophytica]